jgi:hypothetical protein
MIKKLLFHTILIFIVIASGVFLAELSAQFVYKIKNGEWRFRINESSDKGLFILHPYLVGVPRPSVNIDRTNKQGKIIKITHNSLGFRGQEVNLSKKENIKRVVALGGSSTYCAGISNDETWPYILGNKLGPEWEVLNLGVPGYNSVENLIQTALQIEELSPDIAVYYEGWNDMHTIYVKNLKSDYSGFHVFSQYGILRLNDLKIGNQSAAIYYLHNFLLKVFTQQEHKKITSTENAFSANPDYRSLSLYGRNLHSIITLCKQFNITPVMVPQVCNYDILISDKPNPYAWTPFLKEKDFKYVMRFYNDKMKEVASQEKVGFVNGVLEINFFPSDFVDKVHFSYSGNDKFATILADFIKSRHIGPKIN